jgi:signal transduction histidine kinase
VRPSRFARLDADAFHAALGLAPAQVTANLTRAIIERMRAANDRRLEEELRAERLRLVGAMAASIAHDLKSPIGVVQLLADGAPGETAAMLEKTARRMGAMVQDLLDFSRGETTLHPRPVRVSELVADLEEQGLRGAARLGVRVELRVEAEGTLVADPDALFRAFLNLVRNALEAMRDGGDLTLSVEPRGEGDVAFTLTDTGCGIPEELLPAVFEPFATFGKVGGTGLGMATAKAVVEAHGGTIRIWSRPGAGTTCEVVLPGLVRQANDRAGDAPAGIALEMNR